MLTEALVGRVNKVWCVCVCVCVGGGGVQSLLPSNYVPRVKNGLMSFPEREEK